MFDRIKREWFALVASLRGDQKHRFFTRAQAFAKEDNVVYMRNAGKVVRCVRCGATVNLIGDHTLNDLTYDQLYGCHPTDLVPLFVPDAA